MLLSGFTLITNNKVHYGNLALAETLAIVLGIGLWVVGLDIWRGSGSVRKVGGALLLLLAAGYTLCWLGVNYLLADMILS